VLGRPGQVVLPELVGVRSGVPQQFAGLGPGGASAGVVVSDVGWGGVIGYSRSQQAQEGGWNGALGRTTGDSESLWVAPAADVFVGRRVSLGVAAGVLWARQRIVSEQASPYANEAFSVAVSPRIGYLVPLGRGLSFWPRLAVGLSYSEHVSGSPADGWATGGMSRTLSGGVDLALVYHPIPRLLFKLAPQIGVGRTFSEGGSNSGGSIDWWSSDGTWVRIGGEATAGVVF
jgi:hypothetical protein